LIVVPRTRVRNFHRTAMAKTEPLIPKAQSNKHGKASLFYGADEYMSHLKKKYESTPHLADMMSILPDGGCPHAQGQAGAHQGEKMMSLQTATADDGRQRSPHTGRLLPVPNKDLLAAVPELKFMFTKITHEQMIYMWNVLTLIFFSQLSMVALYALALSQFPEQWWTCTICFGLPFIYIAIQNIYIDHDIMHGATFPPFDCQKYITHPFADFLSLPWEEFLLEHQRHHASTQDLLKQGEFGWDPEEFQYWMLEWTWRLSYEEEKKDPNRKKYPWPIHPYGLFLTGALVPVIHFFGLNDTGALFALEWWCHFPDAGTGGKCNKAFWNKYLPQRIKHNTFVACVWGYVWLMGTLPLGRPLSEGWRFMLTVSVCARIGFGLAWMFITNFTHSHAWNHFLSTDPDRSWPILMNVMAYALGGKHRWNEMLFHDLHHAFPSAVGTLSQRGRFHGWKKVYDAGVEILHKGLWMHNGDEKTHMQKTQEKRSILMKSARNSEVLAKKSAKK